MTTGEMFLTQYFIITHFIRTLRVAKAVLFTPHAFISLTPADLKNRIFRFAKSPLSARIETVSV
jgi:hypothetical protein